MEREWSLEAFERPDPWGCRADPPVIGIAVAAGWMKEMTGGDKTAPVYLICVTGEHIRTGTDVPDGSGTLTVVERRWAYCSAGLRNAPHDWKETGGVSFDSIHHGDLPRFAAAG